VSQLLVQWKLVPACLWASRSRAHPPAGAWRRRKGPTPAAGESRRTGACVANAARGGATRSASPACVRLQELGCSRAQLALAWCVRNPHVSTVITGATKLSQVSRQITTHPRVRLRCCRIGSCRSPGHLLLPGLRPPAWPVPRALCHGKPSPRLALQLTWRLAAFCGGMLWGLLLTRPAAADVAGPGCRSRRTSRPWTMWPS
jgi:hypothetical protein